MGLVFPKRNTQSEFSDMKASHTAIRTAQYDTLIQWYIEKLDFRLVKEFQAGSMKIAFIAPASSDTFMIEILGIEPSEHSIEIGELGYDHLCFAVENLANTIEKLQQRSIDIVRKFDMPVIGKRIAFIADPMGNKIEFCEDIE